MNNSLSWKSHEECNIKLVTTGKEETIWCQNQIIIAQSFSQEIYWQQK